MKTVLQETRGTTQRRLQTAVAECDSKREEMEGLVAVLARRPIYKSMDMHRAGRIRGVRALATRVRRRRSEANALGTTCECDGPDAELLVPQAS